MVVVQVTPVCGSKACEVEARMEMEGIQQSVMQSGSSEFQQSVMQSDSAESDRSQVREVREMEEGCCTVCRKPSTRKCAGCGIDEYCSRGCQRSASKEHKRVCGGN